MPPVDFFGSGVWPGVRPDVRPDVRAAPVSSEEKKKTRGVHKGFADWPMQVLVELLWPQIG